METHTSHYKYDAFISYRRGDPDEAFARDLLIKLEDAGYTVAFDQRDFMPGQTLPDEMDRGVDESRFTLAVISPRYFESGHTEMEAVMASIRNMRDQQKRLIPLLISDAQQPRWMSALIPIDFRREDPLAPPFTKLCHTLGSPRFWNVPFQQNKLFTGRETELAALHAILATGKPAALTQVALMGLGGIGKTQTAVEYAYRYRSEYQAILWLRAENESTITTSFSEIGRLLKLPEADAREQAVTVAAVKKWLLDNSGWLLILDNADNLDVARNALPTGLRGHVLITTREQVLGVFAEPIRIVKLSPEEGAAFLLHRANILAAKEEDRAAALELSAAMDGLPLALDQAGAYIEETSTTPARYLALYRTRRGELLKKASASSPTEHISVATTFTLALEKVHTAHPASAELLRLCAFLAPDAIPEEILIAGAEHLGDILGPPMRDELARDEAIKWARKWSLLERDAKAGLLSVHRVVQAVIQEGMEEEERAMWAKRAVMAVNSAFPDVEFSNWSLCEKLLPHVHVCAGHIEEYTIGTPEAALLLDQTGVYQYGCALYVAAETLYRQALAIREKALGSEHPDTATSLNNMAVLYDTVGNHSTAEPLYLRALAIREKVLGRRHPSTAITLDNLANNYRTQGKYAIAEPLYLRALVICEKALGPEHPHSAICLTGLATLYDVQSNYAEAEPLYYRALTINEKRLGPEHPDTAVSYFWLATLRQKQGDFAEAAAFYQKALAIFEKTPGMEHPRTISCQGLYSEMLRLTGRYVEADALEARAIAGRDAHRKKNEKA